MKKKTLKRVFVMYAVIVVMICFAAPVYAAGNPIQVINNLSDFMFSMIRAIGIILLGFGIV